MNALWQRLSPRERTILARGAALALLLLAIAFVALPLERTRARLARQVPATRATVATLDREAAEVRRLRALPANATGAKSEGIAPEGLPELAGAKVARIDERHVRVTAPDVAFTPLLDWIAAAQASRGLRVEHARIEGLAAPGRVRADLTLARS